MQLTEVAHVIQGNLQGENLHFSAIATDSRKLNSGEVYVALVGENFDGHHFIKEVETKGAVAAIVNRPVESTMPLIIVEDTLKALADLASYHRQQFHCPIIAVTGSCGKTTTKMLLTNVFAQKGQVLSNPASFNNSIGVPLTLLQLDNNHDFAITELGANHLGEIDFLSRLVQPQVSIITNAGPAHLKGFGDLNGVAKTKGEIFNGLTAGGVAIINIDDAKAPYWLEKAAAFRIITFGLSPKADVYAKEIIFDEFAKPSFYLVTPAGYCKIKLPLMGQHNIYNALAASAAAFALGLDLNLISCGLEQAEAVVKRLVEYKGKTGAIVIDDSYNANPASMLAAIRLLTQRSNHSILVVGDMLELGEKTADFHHQMGLQAKELGVKQLFCLGEYSQLAAQSFGQSSMHFMDHASLINALKPQLNPKVTVLVKGSRGMTMEKIVEAIRE